MDCLSSRGENRIEDDRMSWFSRLWGRDARGAAAEGFDATTVGSREDLSRGQDRATFPFYVPYGQKR